MPKHRRASRPRASAAWLGRAKCGPASAEGVLGHRLKPARIAESEEERREQGGAAAVAPAGGDDGGAQARSGEAAEREEAVEGRHGRAAAGGLDFGRLQVHGDVEGADGRAEDEEGDEKHRNRTREQWQRHKGGEAAISAAVVGREPNRPSATPASGMVMVAAKAMTKRAMPSSAGSMPRRALDQRDVGCPDAHAEAGDEEGVDVRQARAEEPAGAVGRQRYGGGHGGNVRPLVPGKRAVASGADV